jgi:hypothetical protein
MPQHGGRTQGADALYSYTTNIWGFFTTSIVMCNVSQYNDNVVKYQRNAEMYLFVTWDNPEHTTVLCDYGDDWTPEKSKLAATQIRALYQTTHTGAGFDVIMRIGERCVLPPQTVSYLRDCVKQRSDKTNRVVIVSPSIYVANVCRVAVSLNDSLSDCLLYAESVHEARTLLGSGIASVN